MFFLVGAYFVGLARPLINIDYFVACILFVMPNRFLKWLGILAFIIAIFIDVMMLSMQLFPFLDISAMLSLAPFLVNAPLRYMVLVGLVALYLALMPILMTKISKRLFTQKRDWFYVLTIALFGFLMYQKFNDIRYVDVEGDRFAQSDFFVIHSQYKRYRWMADSEFVKHFSNIPTIKPLSADIENASHHLTNANRVLFIVAESWGVARKESVTDDMLANIYAQKDNFEFIERGYFDASGATVEGELRELCRLSLHGGYAFSKVDDTVFKDCLPHHLTKLGYHAIGMHSGFSQIYERNFLYPKLGFKETIFAEQHNDKKRCSAFNGICDSEMFDVVAQKFASHDKLFFYWLTLTSHASYPKKDIRNHRLDCDKHGLPKGDICNNFMLHTQFFDDLGELIKRPEMAGVEVIVVGDHMPPVMMRNPIHPYIHWQQVSWLHFKVKS
ncbi:LTA synthase family protein [Moraxella oblonga]|uniref:LTA synthase family protein n=1 Tax=Moraxella oblonga TaxID=200413 RepID=UPI001C3F5265|nr:LTA synthase family protein [Moraxella oblonga]